MSPQHKHKGIVDMRSLKFFMAAALVMGVAVIGVTKADEKKEEEWTIKKVMKFAHDKENGVLDKAKDGSISDEDKKKLVSAYEALATLKPAKGDIDDWKKLTTPIAAAAKAYGEGKDEKAAKLAKTLKCMDCHKEFK
jgi:hypothetical protein